MSFLVSDFKKAFVLFESMWW